MCIGVWIAEYVYDGPGRSGITRITRALVWLSLLDIGYVSPCYWVIGYAESNRGRMVHAYRNVPWPLM